MAFLYFFNLAEIFSPSSVTTLDTSFPVGFFIIIFPMGFLFLPSSLDTTYVAAYIRSFVSEALLVVFSWTGFNGRIDFIHHDTNFTSIT